MLRMGIFFICKCAVCIDPDKDVKKREKTSRISAVKVRYGCESWSTEVPESSVSRAGDELSSYSIRLLVVGLWRGQSVGIKSIKMSRANNKTHRDKGKPSESLV
ncbi:hypothetical protein RRG08_064724 [Elysia crispata]|uniref:Uncharacterized protein n=1 Tax=Elysia crispata TaxID=231223 RepID=A0AAE0YZM8_9GAST|nr:hypothetical protein RRG08_064724 [Elysia crispata]